MTRQSVRQHARRAALDAQTERRKERAERERRLEDLSVQVLVSVRERDAFVADCERHAGEALRAMVDAEGLTLREAVEWCADEITLREATRLRRAALESVAAQDASGGSDAETVVRVTSL